MPGSSEIDAIKRRNGLQWRCGTGASRRHFTVVIKRGVQLNPVGQIDT